MGLYDDLSRLPPSHQSPRVFVCLVVCRRLLFDPFSCHWSVTHCIAYTYFVYTLSSLAHCYCAFLRLVLPCSSSSLLGPAHCGHACDLPHLPVLWPLTTIARFAPITLSLHICILPRLTAPYKILHMLSQNRWNWCGSRAFHCSTYNWEIVSSNPG